MMHKERGMTSVKYTIYQLPEESDMIYMNFDYASKHGGVDISEYERVYSGEIEVTEKVTDQIAYVLEKLFVKFNTDIPEDYEGRSMSVSDIVYLEGIGDCFCDSIGWKKLDEGAT